MPADTPQAQVQRVLVVDNGFPCSTCGRIFPTAIALTVHLPCDTPQAQARQEIADLRDDVAEAEAHINWAPAEHKLAYEAIQQSEGLPPNHYPSFQERVWWRAAQDAIAEARQAASVDAEIAQKQYDKLYQELTIAQQARDAALAETRYFKSVAVPHAESKARQSAARTALLEAAEELDARMRDARVGAWTPTRITYFIAWLRSRAGEVK